jgi:pilus assembly protein CpaB
MDRQRLLLIFGGAWISAALLTWFLYARTKAPKAEETVRIVAARRDLPIGTKVAEADLHLVSVVKSQAPRSYLTSPKQASGRALVYPVGANEPVTDARLTALSGAEGAAAVLPQGMRAVSVSFNDTSGVSGLIQPKSRVDVLFTRTGNVYEALTVTLFEDVEVLSIGRVTQVDIPAPGAAAKKAATTSSNTNRTATLVVTPKQAQELELAKNQGRIGLSLRNPLDRSTEVEPSASTLEQIEPMILTRSSTNFRKRRLPGVPGDKEWSELTDGAPAKPKAEPKPEPPKPRAIVDVFRGEKHVQEIFQ